VPFYPSAKLAPRDNTVWLYYVCDYSGGHLFSVQQSASAYGHCFRNGKGRLQILKEWKRWMQITECHDDNYIFIRRHLFKKLCYRTMIYRCMVPLLSVYNDWRSHFIHAKIWKVFVRICIFLAARPLQQQREMTIYIIGYHGEDNFFFFDHIRVSYRYD
jgi:hypothetical protein